MRCSPIGAGPTLPSVRREVRGSGVFLQESRLSRAWVLGVSLVWCGLLIVFSVSEWPVPAGLLALRALGVGLVVWFARRVLSMRMETSGEELMVRNLFRTRRLLRREVERVWVGEPLSAPLPGGWLPGPRGQALNIDARGASFTVDVSREWPSRSRAGQDLFLAAKNLEAWRCDS